MITVNAYPSFFTKSALILEVPNANDPRPRMLDRQYDRIIAHPSKVDLDWTISSNEAFSVVSHQAAAALDGHKMVVNGPALNRVAS